MEASAGIIIAVVITVVVFLVCREIVCWYWKLNKIETLLSEIAANTRKESQLNSFVNSSKSID